MVRYKASEGAGYPPDIMGVRYRDHIAAKNKRKPPGKRFALNSAEAPIVVRTLEMERAALRAEYLRKTRISRAKALEGQKRLIDA